MNLTENMSPEEIRVLRNGVLMAMGMLLVSLAMADTEGGDATEEEPEIPEEQEEESDEGDEGDEGDEDGEDDQDEEDEPEPEGKRAWRRVTEEEVERWCDARDGGMPISEIAREAGRSISVVSKYVREHDAAMADAESDAEDEFDEEEEEA